MRAVLRMRPNRSVDSDTLRQGAAQCRWESCTVRPLAATCRSPLRYIGAGSHVLRFGVFQVPAPRPSRAAWALGSQVVHATPAPRTAAGFSSPLHQGQPRALRPEKRALVTALASAASSMQSESLHGLQGCRFGRRREQLSVSAAPRRTRKAPYNRSVDSDTLRQGAAQCYWKSCTVRPLTATCRSPLR